jgi:methionine synthase II (cobalamin-independent)
VVDARNTRREDPDALAARVRKLKDAVDLASAYLSPSNGLEFLPRDKAREKLAALVSTAKRVGGAS